MNGRERDKAEEGNLHAIIVCKINIWSEYFCELKLTAMRYKMREGKREMCVHEANLRKKISLRLEC